MLERLKARINFLKEWIAALSKAQDFEKRDKLFALEEELNVKEILLKRWSERIDDNAKEEDRQKKEIIAEGGKLLKRLKGITAPDEGGKLMVDGIVERNLKGSHKERWTDYCLMKQILNAVSQLKAV